LSRIREHLDSPQYPDEEPLPDDAMHQRGLSLVKISGGWVQPGRPRSRAYLFFGISLIGGLLLALTSGPGGLDIIGIFGVGFFLFGIFGVAETFVGRKLWRPATREPRE